MQPPVEDGVRGGRDPGEGQDRAEAERTEDGQVEPARRRGQVAEGVRAGVAVVGGVGQRAGAAGVEHEHEGAAPGHRGIATLRERSAGSNTVASTRSKSWGAA